MGPGVPKRTLGLTPTGKRKVMTKGRIDRRVARTRTMLQKAHLALILERGYDAVTVENICEAANVGRSTFYAHFSGKDDLKLSGLEELRHDLSAHRNETAAGPADSARPRFGFTLPMFEHAREHIDLYRALAGGRGGAMALASIRQILADQFRTELAVEPTNGPPREFAVQFLVGAYIAVMTWWLDGGAKASPQEMDALFRRMAGVQASLQ
jgi:AcrR family transcriptional regulator